MNRETALNSTAPPIAESRIPEFALKVPQLAPFQLLRVPDVVQFVCQELPKSSEVSPKTANCEVTHLGQLHAVPGKAPDNFVSSVISSQTEIVRFLRSNKDSAVVLEGLTESLTPALFLQLSKQEPSIVGAAKLIFPKGIPESAKELTELQREFLYESGAARTMWYLGELKQVHKAITPEASEKIDAQVKKLGEDKYGKAWALAVEFDKELKALIFDKRETAAFAEVASLRKDGAKAIILIFGQGHNFARFGADDKSLAIKAVKTTQIDLQLRVRPPDRAEPREKE